MAVAATSITAVLNGQSVTVAPSASPLGNHDLVIGAGNGAQTTGLCGHVEKVIGWTGAMSRGDLMRIEARYR